MTLVNELILALGGIFSGILAGLLGAGGGVICVPLMLALNYTPIQALGTGCLAVSIISISGSIQNSRMGYFSPKRVICIGISAFITTQISVHAVSQIKPYLLLTTFGILMLLLICLVELRKKLTAVPQGSNTSVSSSSKNLPKWINSLLFRRLMTGSFAGLFAGMVGGGSGSLLVPMQMLILGESIKVAIQTSIGVNIITSTSAWLSHALRGNVLFVEGFLLGVGGFLGAQVGTRFLPKLPEKFVSTAFNSLIVILSIYIFGKAWRSYGSF
ncbi:MAG: sulfite exporter TauE/SafE family protein [Cyanobacteria bacterium CRU_2_1]|nr:sulfite exporter TauE/SafE family protein [Cyanobacteria bacterium CRU_2_1]